MNTIDKQDTWPRLEEKGEVTRCVKCGRKIWKFWYSRKEDLRRNNNLGGPLHPEMDKCANCYFGR